MANTPTPTTSAPVFPVPRHSQDNPAPCRECRMVPQIVTLREEIEAKTAAYVAREKLIAPMDWNELIEHRDRLLSEVSIPAQYNDFAAVMLSNAVWEPVLRNIPYEKRVLLLPQCLRDEARCEAEIDEFGLLCLECGACSIGPLQQFAERLGYSVVVAEGTTIVTQMIESGQVQAVIGVSCMATLERAFPSMAAHAVPGVAIPLQREGCKRTQVDTKWLMRVLSTYNPDAAYHRMDLDEMRAEVRHWFKQEELSAFLNLRDTPTEQCALDFMASGGKRWRPLLTAAAHRALTGHSQIPYSLRNAAIAVECFHKASLVHDDIVDEQEERYGVPALYRTAGKSVALNVGDLLIGEGYRLLAECGYGPEVCARLLRIAACGHRELCLGQGGELWSAEKATRLDVDEAVEIFRCKTAPAFNVALSIGAVCADADEATLKALESYSNALGVAYQIQDDLDDIDEDAAAEDAVWTPSIIGALERQLCESEGMSPAEAAPQARKQARAMIDRYRAEALRSIRGLRKTDLKSLLHRLCTKILPHG